MLALSITNNFVFRLKTLDTSRDCGTCWRYCRGVCDRHRKCFSFITSSNCTKPITTLSPDMSMKNSSPRVFLLLQVHKAQDTASKRQKLLTLSGEWCTFMFSLTLSGKWICCLFHIGPIVILRTSYNGLRFCLLARFIPLFFTCIWNPVFDFQYFYSVIQ